MSSSRSRAFAVRLVAMAAGVAVALVLAELLLQAAALFVGGTDRATGAGARGTRRVVCLGDSNTYGLFLDASQAWPAQVEAVWNRDAPAGDTITVENLGHPGVNSSRVREVLPEVLAGARPDLLLVLVGVNDFWTEPVPHDGEHRSFGSVAWQYSRVYRLLSLLARTLRARGTPTTDEVLRRWRGPEDVVPELLEGGVARLPRGSGQDLEVGWKHLPGGRADWVEGLLHNLAAIADIARAQGVPLVLLTYPAGGGMYPPVNEVIRKAARASGISLIDLEPLFASRCIPNQPCPAYFFSDWHGNAAAYAVVADALHERLRELPELRTARSGTTTSTVP